jgi:hypothetical protein
MRLSKTRALFALVATALFVTSTLGCAALRAPVHLDAAGQAEAADEAALSVEIVEGRPDGLVLRFRCECAPATGSWLVLMRSQQDQQARVHRSIQLSPELGARLQGDGVEFLDRAVQPDAKLSYQLHLREAGPDGPDQSIEVSAPVEVVWQQPPPKPDQVSAHSPVAGYVEFGFQAPRRFQGLVFRRNVLEKGPIERLAQLDGAADGVFVDRDVMPAGVYAYRVALAVELDGGVLQYGPPSDEIYVTVKTTP